MTAPDRGAKQATDISASFRYALVDLILARPNTRTAFVAEMRTLISVFLTDAFLRGVRDGGGGTITIDDLEPDEKQLFNSLLLIQNGYVAGFGFDLYNQAITEAQAIQQRVPLWTNKGVEQFYNVGMTVGRGNQMLEWFLGATEQHCSTCAAAAGQRHRASTWRRSGILPQSDKLECGGFRCDCYLEPTNLPASGSLARVR